MNHLNLLEYNYIIVPPPSQFCECISSCGRCARILHTCFSIKVTFQYQSSPCFILRECFSSRFLVHFMIYNLFPRIQMVLCFYWMYIYVSLFFIISIHSKYIHPQITSSFCKFLCFMYYSFNMCLIFIGCTHSMFYIPRLFWSSNFFIFFLAN